MVDFSYFRLSNYATMRKTYATIALLLSVFFSFSAHAQTESFQELCNQTYVSNPTMPRGVIEAYAFAQTREQHLSGFQQEGCSGIPQAVGYLGLIENGKKFFRNNLTTISKLSRVSVNKIKTDPKKELHAFARAYNRVSKLYKNLDQAQQIKFSLRYLSLIPEGNIVQDFAANSELYEVFKSLIDPVFAQNHGFVPYNFNLENVFGTDVYRVLSSSEVKFTETGIFDSQNVPYVASDLLSTQKSTEFGPAIWNAAPSCNYSSRAGTAISAIVIHTIQGSYSSAISWSQNCASSVSFHYVIRSSDGQVTQMLLEAVKGWHVGSANPYTIGYEHEGYVAQSGWYTTAMYNSSAALTRDVCQSGYGINPLRTYFGASTVDVSVLGNCTRIKGHQHYPSQSHNDPGINWDWPRYYRLVNTTFTPTSLTTASGMLYDSGGAAGNYLDDQRTFQLIQPAGATSISLNFTGFNLENNWDFLFIYDGSTTSAPLIGTYTGTNLPGNISSSGGSLLIEFRSDCATPAAGYAATWTSNAIPPVATDNINPTTIVSVPTNWVTANFTASFIDADNVGGSGLEKAYYQVIDYDGVEWRANAANGFFSDNFDGVAINPEWTIQVGTWDQAGQTLNQTDETNGNTNVSASLNHTLSNRYLYHWSGKMSGTGTNRRCGLHYFSSDPLLPNRGNGYLVIPRLDNDNVQLYRISGDVLTNIGQVNYDFIADTWYDYKMIYDRVSGKHQFYINNQLIINYTDLTPITTGNYISFRSGNAVYSVNNLKVYRSRSTTATVSLNAATGDIRFQNLDPITASARVKSISQDSAGNLSSIISADVNVDWTVPSTISSVSDGTAADIATTTSNTELSANWSSSADPNSGIARYWFAIGTSSGATDIQNWTDNSWNSAVTVSGLNLTYGTTYYFAIKSENGAGLVSPITISNGQLFEAPTSAPIANFTVTNTFICLGSNINLQNTSSNATTYQWSFTGGLPATSSAVHPSVTFANSGSYLVELIATGPGGTNTTSQTINVQVEVPSVASFSSSATTVYVPNTTVTFTNNSTNANGYYWNFGDGTTSTDENPWHQFTSVGVYEVSLVSINNSCPNDSSNVVSITVVDEAGIEENTILPISLFPNPAMSEVTIETPIQKGTILCYDNAGKLVLSSVFENGKKIISVKDFANGIYKIVVQNESVKSQKTLYIAR